MMLDEAEQRADHIAVGGKRARRMMVEILVAWDGFDGVLDYLADHAAECAKPGSNPDPEMRARISRFYQKLERRLRRARKEVFDK